MARENSYKDTVKDTGLEGSTDQSEVSGFLTDHPEFVRFFSRVNPSKKQPSDLAPSTELQGPCEGGEKAGCNSLKATSPLLGPSEVSK